MVDEMCTLLERKLSYTEGERDMVAMHHEILVRLPNGAQQKRTCSFVGKVSYSSILRPHTVVV